MQSAGSGTEIDPRVIQVLLGTRPWVRFMAVLMFIGAGLMVLVALVMLAAGGTVFGMGDLPGGGMAVIALIYAALAILYIYPALKLWSYASKINVLASMQDSNSLFVALDQQRSFWKFIGVMMLIVISLYVVIGFGAVIIGVASAT